MGLSEAVAQGPCFLSTGLDKQMSLSPEPSEADSWVSCEAGNLGILISGGRWKPPNWTGLFQEWQSSSGSKSREKGKAPVRITGLEIELRVGSLPTMHEALCPVPTARKIRRGHVFSNNAYEKGSQPQSAPSGGT